MNETKTLQELFVEELRDSYDAEQQLTKALKKMASAALDPALEAAFSGHLQETMGQVQVLERVFGLLNIKPKGKHCDGIAGIIKESESDVDNTPKCAVRDSALIGGGRRAEHYEIAAYRSLIAMGEELDYTEACNLLRGVLAQEEAADQKLTGLASEVNGKAHTEQMSHAG
jgi:ferritin-like metal-binding protein YciE